MARGGSDEFRRDAFGERKVLIALQPFLERETILI